MGDTSKPTAIEESATLLGVDTVLEGFVDRTAAPALTPLLSVPGCPAATDFLTCNPQIVFLSIMLLIHQNREKMHSRHLCHFSNFTDCKIFVLHILQLSVLTDKNFL
jgi:hypothetical protein